MKFRGPGDLEGTAQSGLPFDLRIANLVGDAELMSEAREAARKILQQDANHELSIYTPIWEELRRLKHQRQDFSGIS